MNLSKLKIKEKRYTVRLGESLYLRIYPSGHKSFVLRYNVRGIVKDVTLGFYPDLSLVQARQLAHLKREELRIKPSRGLTFTDAFKLWCQKKKNYIVSYEVEKRRIEIYLLPKLKKLQLEQITAPLALNLLLALKDRPPTLKRILMRLNEILDLAVCAGLLANNPCRKLSRVFAPYKVKNRPYIQAIRLGELFVLLKGQKLEFHCFVLWAVYSMLRPIECVSVRWAWIEGDTLTLPAEIMKKRRVHRVHLCPDILAILELVHTDKRNAYVWHFTSGSHVHKQYLSRFLNRSALNGQLCHHGLRATAMTWLKDQNIPFEVAEDCLAHVYGSQTERAYLRGDYLEQRREIYQKWFKYIFEAYCAVCAEDFSGSQLIKAVNSVKA